MGRMQREKGAKFERLVVNKAKEKGLVAQRMAPMQTGFGQAGYSDVMVESWSIECKHHDRVSVVAYDSWTDKPLHALVYQHNRSRPKVVLDLEEFLEMVKMRRDYGKAP